MSVCEDFGDVQDRIEISSHPFFFTRFSWDFNVTIKLSQVSQISNATCRYILTLLGKNLLSWYLLYFLNFFIARFLWSIFSHNKRLKVPKNKSWNLHVEISRKILSHCAWCCNLWYIKHDFFFYLLLLHSPHSLRNIFLYIWK